MDGEARRHRALDPPEDRVERGRAERPAPGEVGPGERDAAADVHAHGVRDDGAVGEQDAPDRHPEARVSVGHERHVVTGDVEVREIDRLRDRLALDVRRPAPDGQPPAVDDVHRRFRVLRAV